MNGPTNLERPSVRLWIACLLAMVTTCALAKDPEAERCERLWQTESSSLEKVAPRDEGQAPDYLALLRRWQGHQKDCGATVVYEARLATAYLLAKQPGEARAVLKPLLGQPSDYSYLVEFTALQIDYFENLLYRQGTNEGARKVEALALAFVKKYPDFPDGRALLGGLQVMLGEYPEAVKSLEAGLRSEMRLVGTYRNLTISYAEVGRYQDAIKAADHAVQLDRSVTNDQYFVYAVAKADAGLGDLKNAQLALKVIAAKKPEVRRDPEFKRAVDFVIARMPAEK